MIPRFHRAVSAKADRQVAPICASHLGWRPRSRANAPSTAPDRRRFRLLTVAAHQRIFFLLLRRLVATTLLARDRAAIVALQGCRSPMSALGQSRPRRSKPHARACPLRAESGQNSGRLRRSALCRLCCKSPKLPGDKFPATRRTNRRPAICVASIALPKSPVSSSSGDEVPHIFTRKSRLQPGEFLITSAKRLLQQYLPKAPDKRRPYATPSCDAIDPKRTSGHRFHRMSAALIGMLVVGA
jgi:hypothetical protein